MTIFTAPEAAFIRKLPEKKRVFLTGLLFLYVFRGNNQAQIREALEERDVPFDFLAWRRRLHKNGLLLRDGKIWLYSTYCGKEVPKKNFKDLTVADYVFLKYALRYAPLRKRLFELQKDEARDPLTPTLFDKYTEMVLSSVDLLTYTRKMMYRKMSFLVQSYGETFQGLESDLMTWALFALLKAYPRFDDHGHGLAIAKTTVKRRCVNLIKSKTTKGNNELITREDKDGNKRYERTTVSMSNMMDGTGQFLTADGTFVHRSFMVVGIDGVNSHQNTVGWETQQAIKQLLDSQMLNPLHKKFLSLMLGDHDSDFTEFLGEENEDYIERCDYTAYMQKVCMYMGIPKEKAVSFLDSLKPHLGGTAQSDL